MDEDVRRISRVIAIRRSAAVQIAQLIGTVMVAEFDNRRRCNIANTRWGGGIGRIIQRIT
jgi:hypothetical protein